jgi:gluconolactonase
LESTLLASGLGFPEGPAVLGDGRIVLCDGNTGELLAYQNERVSTYARTGGSPWGTVLGTDGAIYVTQGGNVPGSGDTSAVSGIQRVQPDGSVELMFSEVDGYPLYGPNDLAFGPDSRLYFTESGSEQDFRFDVRSPGRLFAIGADGAGEMLFELPGVYPNGIAFDARGRLYWTESMAHRVCRLDGGGEPETFCQLSDGHVPDGMAFAADGRLFVATTISGGVTVISPDGAVLSEINLGEHATNCIFDGPALYVTATKVPDIEASQRTGSFWRVQTDATGLPLIPGRL